MSTFFTRMALGGTLVLLAAVFIFGLAAWFNSDTEAKTGVIELRVQADQPITASSTTPAHPDGPDSHWFYSDVYTVTADTMVSDIEVDLQGASLESIHHMSVVILNEPSAICASDSHADTNEIYTASRNNIREPVSFPAPYGIKLDAGDQIVLEFMEHTRAEPHGPGGEAMIPELIVRLQTDATRAKPMSFVRLRLDDSPCAKPLAHQAYVVPPGDGGQTRVSSTDEAGSFYVFPENGTLLYRSGNFWASKGGTEAVLYINDAIVDTFTATRLSEPWQWAISASETPLRVAKGDMASLGVTYNNPFPTPIMDASGMIGFYFAPDTE